MSKTTNVPCKNSKYDDRLFDNVYYIPINDKYIFYAPLKPLAFVGNKALMSQVTNILKNYPTNIDNNDNIYLFLETIGFFEDDTLVPASVAEYNDYMPTMCILMPTTSCNLRCTYCYAMGAESMKKLLDWPVAKKAIDTVFENSLKLNHDSFTLGFHGGGEPTYSFSFFKKACEYAKKLNGQCTVTLTTNGYWTENQRKEILELVDEISLSFDGDKKTQNRQRPDFEGHETFSNVMKTIVEIEKKKIPYGIRLTITEESIHDLVDNIEFLCKETNCQTFQIEPVYDQGRASNSNAVISDIELFVSQFMEAWQVANESGRNVFYSAARPWIVASEFCTAFSKALIVTADGELTSCYEAFDRTHDFADDFLFGKIDKNDGCILYTDKREQLSEKIALNKQNCYTCFCYYHCAGDCPPKAFHAHEKKDNQRCEITRKITRELLLEKISNTDGVWYGEKSVFQENINTDKSNGYKGN